FLARLSHLILCCSRAVADHARHVVGIPERLLRVVPNGIDPPPAVDRGEALESLGRPAPPVIGCVASLAPHKGQAVLLRAVDYLRPDRPLPTLVVVDDGRTGLLVPPGEPAALAAAVGSLLDRPELRHAMGAEGRRQVAERFRTAGLAERIENLYEEAIRARRAA